MVYMFPDGNESCITPPDPALDIVIWCVVCLVFIVLITGLIYSIVKNGKA